MITIQTKRDLLLRISARAHRMLVEYGSSIAGSDQVASLVSGSIVASNEDILVLGTSFRSDVDKEDIFRLGEEAIFLCVNDEWRTRLASGVLDFTGDRFVVVEEDAVLADKSP